MKNKGVTNGKIMGFLVEMDERVTNMGEQITEIRTTMATKDDLELLRQDIRDEMEPFRFAVDKDAKTIVDHEKRITVLERTTQRIA